MTNIIECNGLTKLYGNVCALNELTFSLPDLGGIVGLLGPNGSGKTTLIKILTGMLSSSSGTAKVIGKEIGVETKAMVSYLSDTHALNNSFTVKKQLIIRLVIAYLLLNYVVLPLLRVCFLSLEWEISGHVLFVCLAVLFAVVIAFCTWYELRSLKNRINLK